jgi:succinoglycan biosynthesis protein ExoO
MRVSVVIPAFNAGDFIVRAIDSALSQGQVLHEVIVVDDGSSDDTRAAVSDSSQRDPRVRLVKLPMNQGPGPARNAGFATATGDWIAILDADDVYLPGRLDYLVEKAEEFKLDFAADNILFFDYAARQVSRIGIRPEMIGAVLYVNRYEFVKNCCGTSDVKVDFGLLQPIVRASFLRRQNLSYPPIRHGEDFAFCLGGLLAGGRFGVFPEAYYMVTERIGGISGKSSPLTRTTVDFGGMERHARGMAEAAQANGDRELAELLRKRATHMLRMSLIRQVKNHWKSRQLQSCARLVCTDRRALTACFGAGFRKMLQMTQKEAREPARV